MTDAQIAINEIKKALNEYGTDIVLRKVTQDGYDPLTGESITVSDYDLKAFVSNVKADDVEVIGDYEMSLMFYTELEVTKKDEIVYNGNIYKIIFVKPTILQNTVIKYEVFVKR